MNIRTALAATTRAAELWFASRRLPDVPLFSGGLMDWPNWFVESLAVLEMEHDAVEALLEAERG